MFKITFDDKYLLQVNENQENFENYVRKGAALLFFIQEKLTHLEQEMKNAKEIAWKEYRSKYLDSVTY